MVTAVTVMLPRPRRRREGGRRALDGRYPDELVGARMYASSDPGITLLHSLRTAPRIKWERLLEHCG